MNEVINPDLEKYLDLHFQNINEKMDILIQPMQKDIDHHREDLLDLFKRDITTQQLIIEVITRLNNHEKNHDRQEGSKQWTIGQIVTILVCIAAILAAKFL